MILKVWLPIALRYKIDYETFWNINPRIINIYQEEYRRRIEEQQKLMDYEAWLRGQYQMASIGAALSKKCKYPALPFSMQEEEKGLSDEEQFLLWADKFNHQFEESDK
ncbi:MAG: hypothetical protein K1W22_12225 [Lachnospiraceae bacterium]